MKKKTEPPECCDGFQAVKGSPKFPKRCCPSPAAPSFPSPAPKERRTLRIELLYLDLSACGRCKDTDASLQKAVEEASKVLEAAGMEIHVSRVHVRSEEQARSLGFVSSPTIRLNGRDLQLEVKESPCESCGDLAGEAVDCRMWAWRGKEYTFPPKEMIVDALLREVYGRPDSRSEPAGRQAEPPENLKRFFRARRGKTGCDPPKGRNEGEKEK